MMMRNHSWMLSKRSNGRLPRVFDSRHFRRLREGAITLWTVIALPALLVLFCIVLEIGQLWHARVEFSSALEAAALASANSWGDAGGGPGNTSSAANVGTQFAAANTINGQPVAVDVSAFTFGTVTPRASDPSYSFTAGVPTGPRSTLAVHVQATASVESLCESILGLPIGGYDVTTQATALYDETALPKRARLVRIGL
jgi:Flp pilus assembly protein TadG